MLIVGGALLAALGYALHRFRQTPTPGTYDSKHLTWTEDPNEPPKDIYTYYPLSNPLSSRILNGSVTVSGPMTVEGVWQGVDAWAVTFQPQGDVLHHAQVLGDAPHTFYSGKTAPSAALVEKTLSTLSF